MRRVASRQRFAYEDEFDHVNLEDSFDELTAGDGDSTAPGLVDDGGDGNGNGDDCSLLSMKRKRQGSFRTKQEPIHRAPSTISMSSSSDTVYHEAISFPWKIEGSSSSSVYDDITATVTTALEGCPDEVKLHIFSFLATDSLSTCLQLNRGCRRFLLGEDAVCQLWKDCCARQWPFLATTVEQHRQRLSFVDSFNIHTPVAKTETSSLSFEVGDNHHKANLSLLLSLAAENQPPTRIDASTFGAFRPRTIRHQLRPNRTISFDPELKMVQVHSRGQDKKATSSYAAVQFTGRVGQGDRSIRANKPLPRPVAQKVEEEEEVDEQPSHNCGAKRPSLFNIGIFRHHQHHRLLKNNSENNKNRQLQLSSWRAFVAPYVNAEPTLSSAKNGTTQIMCHLTPRLISYYEVTILEAPEQQEGSDDGNRISLNRKECVAVGLAMREFPMYHRMPGWDAYSFGYHGDDGGIFHAKGYQIRHYGPEFGVGDTVGCGIDYANRSIFFTLNGKYLGPAWSNLSDAILSKDWYPIIGLDTRCPVASNFGADVDRPFLFNLNKMICQQKEVVLQSIG